MQWHLPASSGRNGLSGEFFVQRVDKNGAQIILSRIELNGTFRPRFGDYMEGEEIPDYSVTLHQVVLQRQGINLLIEQLNKWIQTPLEISAEIAKAAGNDQSLHISLGPVKELISSIDRPACTIRYSSGAFTLGTWSFVVDQSCIKLFLNELTQSLHLNDSTN